MGDKRNSKKSEKIERQKVTGTENLAREKIKGCPLSIASRIVFFFFYAIERCQ